MAALPYRVFPVCGPCEVAMVALSLFAATEAFAQAPSIYVVPRAQPASFGCVYDGVGGVLTPWPSLNFTAGTTGSGMTAASNTSANVATLDFHLTHNDLNRFRSICSVDIYVRGAPFTPYEIDFACSQTVQTTAAVNGRSAGFSGGLCGVPGIAVSAGPHSANARSQTTSMLHSGYTTNQTIVHPAFPLETYTFAEGVGIWAEAGTGANPAPEPAGSGAGAADLVMRATRILRPNQPPVARMASPVAVVNVPAALDGSNSADPDGTIVEYRWTVQRAGGGTDVLLGPRLTYAWSVVGTFAVSLTVTDNDGRTDTANALASVVVGSDAAPDAYTFVPGKLLTIPAAAGVLTNDTGSALTASLETSPSGGTLRLDPTGGFVFQPEFDAVSTTFTYRATNTRGSAVATVTLTRAVCGSITPRLAIAEIPGDSADLADAELLEQIADYPQPQKEQELRSQGFLSFRGPRGFNETLASAIAGFQSLFSLDPPNQLPRVESGYRPERYQAHFWNMRQIREALWEFVYVGTGRTFGYGPLLSPRQQAEFDRRFAECAPITNDITAHAVGYHGIARSRTVVRAPGFERLIVGNPVSRNSATHVRGLGVDLGVSVSSRIDERLAQWNGVAGNAQLTRPYLPDDAPHFGLASGSNSNNSLSVRWSSSAGSTAAVAAPNAAVHVTGAIVTDPLGRRAGADAGGQVVNEIGANASLVTSLGVAGVVITDAVPGVYSVSMEGSSTGPGAVELVANGDESRRVLFASTVVGGGATRPLQFSLRPAADDVAPPVVTPPPAMTVVAPAQGGVLVGDVQKLRSFLVGATASDARDEEPEPRQPRLGAQAIDATTVLPIGRQRVSFDFTDGSGNTGSAESEILVLAPVPGAPAVPTMTANVVGTLVTASWGPGIGGGDPTRYRVRVSSSPGLADVAVLDVGSLRSGEGHLPSGIYYLSAEAINAAGATVSDEVRVYVGGPPPPPPTLSAVVNGQQVALRWQPGPGAFTLQVGSQVGASDIATLPLGTQTEISGTLPPGTYFARLIASSGTGSATSNEVVLQTSCLPPPAPALAVTVTGARVALAWPTVPGAVAYRLQAGSSPSLSDLVDLNVGSSLGFDAAAPRGTYYVRLVADSACGARAVSPEVTVVVP